MENTLFFIGEIFMELYNIFSRALGIDKPWIVVGIDFDVTAKRLDIMLDFVKGSTFSFEQDGVINQYKAYDTIEKECRHLNFFEYECYSPFGEICDKTKQKIQKSHNA